MLTVSSITITCCRTSSLTTSAIGANGWPPRTLEIDLTGELREGTDHQSSIGGLKVYVFSIRD